MRPDSRFAAVLICFFLSGLAALLYQTAWIREFSFVFGTSAIAIAAVLAAYMSGLAVGAAAAGRFLTRVRRPVLVYGVLEAAIAASALAVPLLLRGATAACHELLGGHPELPAEGGTAVLAFFFVSSFLILMVPTAFMGATLPLLIRAAVHTDAQVGPRTGVLYGINTAGAVCGTVLAAFTLLPAIGLRATVHVGVGVNFVVFLIAAVIARKPARNQPPKDIDAVASVPFHPTPAARVMLALVCLSGVTSFTYEVLWTRLLSHV
ncbi:MAG: fused MFS/spermidine synthase, partial [Planctomycetota bacterium]